MKLLSVIITFSCILFAQADKPPVISEQMMLRYWKYEAKLLADQIKTDKDKAESRQNLEEMIKLCGDYRIIPDSEGGPVCGSEKKDKDK